ncbi:hypothetical protein K32_22090 [Kaistia sp. 32K]|uniref:hypothetical protein n=1 Tax=Kaistia sp. 32K TaxID=2795690 RepID=UPI001916AB25|nr:hypothetical protein [Kaistia sp. 32K]BCP53592.1 hypothetical protein K32_22090 [Kaistia sp. 32K]
MKPTGIKRCRPVSLLATLALAVTLAGCSQISKTFDTTPDPELERAGVFPNINVAGGQPPGKLMNADELSKATAGLKAKAGNNDPATAEAARKASEASNAALEKTAATHAKKALSEIQDRCGEPGADATKCPQ